MDRSIGRKRLWAAMRAEEGTASSTDGGYTSVHSKLDDARHARLPGNNRYAVPTPTSHGVVEQYRPQMYGRPLGRVRTPTSRGNEASRGTVLSTATLAPGAAYHALHTYTRIDRAGMLEKSIAGPGTSVVTSISIRPLHGGSINPIGQASIGHSSAHTAADLIDSTAGAFQQAQSGQLGPVTRVLGPQQEAGGANAQEYRTQYRGAHAWPPGLNSYVQEANLDQGGGIRERPLETPPSSFLWRAAAQVVPIWRQPAYRAASMPLARSQHASSGLGVTSGGLYGSNAYSYGRVGPVAAGYPILQQREYDWPVNGGAEQHLARYQLMTSPYMDLGHSIERGATPSSHPPVWPRMNSAHQDSSSRRALGNDHKFGNTSTMDGRQYSSSSSWSRAAGTFRGVQMSFGGARRFPVAALEGQVLRPAWQLLADDARSRAAGGGSGLRSLSAHGIVHREGLTWGQAPRLLGSPPVHPQGRLASWAGGAAHMPWQSDYPGAPPPLKHPRVSVDVGQETLTSQGIALQGVPAALPALPRVSQGQGLTHGDSRAPGSGSMSQPELPGPPPSGTPQLGAPPALEWSAGSGAADTFRRGATGAGLPTSISTTSGTIDVRSSTRTASASSSRAAVQPLASRRRIRSDRYGHSVKRRGPIPQASSPATEPHAASAPGMIELSEVMGQVPAEWGKRGSKTRWFRHVMGSNRHGSSAVAMRRSKTAEVIRLFDDFDFSIRCSTELLRRGCRDSIEIVPSRPSTAGAGAGAGAGEGAGTPAGVRVRLLKGFSYTEVDGWTHGDGGGKWQVLLEDQCIGKPQASPGQGPQAKGKSQAEAVSPELAYAGPSSATSGDSHQRVYLQGEYQGTGSTRGKSSSSSSSSSSVRAQDSAASGSRVATDRAADICFVPPDPAGRQVRGYQLYIVFRPVGAIARRPKQYRTPVQRGVSVAKLLRGGTERRTSICAKLRSVTSPDPNGDEDVLQWIDELVKYGII